MTTITSTYRAFADQALGSVRRVGQTFTQPDDWMPVLLVQTHDGQCVIIAVAFDEARKDFAVAGMVAALKQLRAERCAFVVSAWQSMIDKNWDGRPARLQPDRREIVSVTVIDRERVEGYTAPIERHADTPPTLGEWDCLRPEQGSISGRFVDPLQAAMR